MAGGGPEPLERLIDLAARLGALLRLLVALAFAVMVAAAIAQVVSRYVFNRPLGWTEELARLVMLWWTFVAVGLLAASRKLMTLDALLYVLPARSVHGLRAAAHLVAAAAALWLTWLGGRLVLLAGRQVTPALDLPYGWVYLSLPVGLGIAGAAFLVHAMIDLGHLRRGTAVVRPGLGVDV